ncbi:membrane bound O-acyl transferase family-domain-containing protein [Crepidotus variabilis]|uniref:Membrane bound O-acyl transferase family-domain-containing protein n=1 Tax=Crepidotus variabilis TaxID=179855 RepID=A0A9P6JRM7_9AGAR|nr:membrane bound O-acyl transferase family-domain-containing protein [Crepidotus variabilis]
MFSNICSLDPSSKPPFPLPIHSLVEGLLILSLAVKPSPYRALIFFPPIAILVLWSLSCTRIQLGNIGDEMGLASRMILVLMSAAADILLSEPQKEVKLQKPYVLQDKKFDDGQYNIQSTLKFNGAHGHAQVGDLTQTNDSDDTNIQGRYPENISRAPFLTRLKWAATLHLNQRGLGFMHEPTYALPSRPSPSTTRKTFVLQRLFAISIFYVLIDIGRVTVHIYDYRRRWMLENHGGFGLFDPWKLWIIGFGVKFVGMLGYVHTCVAVLAVGLSFSRPQDWPFFFDIENVANICSLKQFWGKFWHQSFRRVFQMHANFIAHTVLRFPKSRSKFILYTKVTLVFLLSGLLHFFTDSVALQSLSVSGALQFYLIQVVGLVIEDTVANLWRYIQGSGTISPKGPSEVISMNGSGGEDKTPPSTSPPTAFKLLGLLWVLLWLGYTLPMWADPLIDGGYMEDVSKGAFSILMGLWQGQWFWPKNNAWLWDGVNRPVSA